MDRWHCAFNPSHDAACSEIPWASGNGQSSSDVSFWPWRGIRETPRVVTVVPRSTTAPNRVDRLHSPTCGRGRRPGHRTGRSESNATRRAVISIERRYLVHTGHGADGRRQSQDGRLRGRAHERSRGARFSDLLRRPWNRSSGRAARRHSRPMPASSSGAHRAAARDCTQRGLCCVPCAQAAVRSDQGANPAR